MVFPWKTHRMDGSPKFDHSSVVVRGGIVLSLFVPAGVGAPIGLGIFAPR